MPKTLVVVRHAKSDWSGHHSDRERPLAERGQRQAPRSGRWLAEQVRDRSISAPGLAVVSPAERTRATWALIAAELAATPPARLDERIYAGSGEELLAVVREIPAEVEVAVLVGHLPGVEDLVELLTGEWVSMPTSAMAAVWLPTDWLAIGGRRGVVRAHGRPPEGPLLALPSGEC